MLLRLRHRFQQGKKRLGHNPNPMSRQDNDKTNNFKSQHEKGSYDQGSVVDNINEVATCFRGRDIYFKTEHNSPVATRNRKIEGNC